MATEVRKVGGGGWRIVEAGGIVAALGAVGVINLHQPSPPSTDLRRSDVHAEFIKYASGRDSITAYIAYPERRDAAPAVIVIHEVFGMSDFIKQTTQRLAQQEIVVLAPDLLTPRGGTTAQTDFTVAVNRPPNA